MTSAFSEVTDITYDGTGSRVTQKTLPNGNYETYTYDVRGRVEDIVLKNSGHTVLRKLEHTFDAVDNITEIVETRGSAVTKTFGYDDIDQLISEDWSTGYTADYEYDENGNRTKRTVGATVEDYFYDDGDKLTEIKIGGSVTKSYDYDMSGRRTEMTDGGGTTYYGYDLGDRLTSITRSGLTTNSFSYNGFDTRVSKTDTTGTTAYKRAGAEVTSSLLRTTVSSTTVDYTPGISAKTSGVTDPSFMYSGLKSTDYQTAGGSTSTRDYDAYGKEISTSGAWVGPLKYGGAYGYQTDPDHGLKLLGHRYYEADTGRFLTRDPIKDGRNWYGYCGNNPQKRADPMGLSWHDPLVIYVDPGFEGTVTVVGEPGPGKPAAFVVIKPGFHSNPKMDVDYIHIKWPNGAESTVFAMGWGTPINPDNTPQLATIDKAGKLHTDGPVSAAGDFVSPFWLGSYSAGLGNAAPPNCQPLPGLYKIPKKATRPRTPRGKPLPIVGTRPGSSGNIIWEN